MGFIINLIHSLFQDLIQYRSGKKYENVELWQILILFQNPPILSQEMVQVKMGSQLLGIV
ncbi:hypothetical protein CW304_21195 [Bacillus sp. UFRGS-B20]|nr:hypothetical protein CW304_21195 [Bacillus sp. UFRGS-B20]